MEDAPTQRATKIPAVPDEGQAFDNSRPEESRSRDSAVFDNGADRERPINTRKCNSTKTQGANPHSAEESQCTRVRTNDDGARDCYGFS